MPRTSSDDTLLSHLKGLSAHLRTDEQPIASIPAIWDSGHGSHSTPCDVVVTNQRLLGFYFRSFPREKLFLESLSLSSITNVTLRQKSFSPVFRELMLSDGQQKVFIRAPRQKIEDLYSALRSTIKLYMPTNTSSFSSEDAEDASGVPSAPIYGRQDIHVPFDHSPLAITLLFIGGIILEILGVLLWSATQSAQIGLPLCFAGFVAAITGILLKRARTRKPGDV